MSVVKLAFCTRARCQLTSEAGSENPIKDKVDDGHIPHRKKSF